MELHKCRASFDRLRMRSFLSCMCRCNALIFLILSPSKDALTAMQPRTEPGVRGASAPHTIALPSRGEGQTLVAAHVTPPLTAAPPPAG